MIKFVVDASTILYFLLKTNKKVALYLTNILRNKAKNTRIYAPIFLKDEVGNGLRFSLKEKDKAEKTFHLFLNNFPIDYIELKPLHYLKILSLSYKLQATFYDTSYHYIAFLKEAIFLTCDERYYKQAKLLGNIKLLTK